MSIFGLAYKPTGPHFRIFLNILPASLEINLNSKPIEELEGRCHKGSNGGGGGGSNPLSNKEVTMATEPQSTSRHLLTQHRKPVSGMNSYPKNKCGWGRERGGGGGGKGKKRANFARHTQVI